MAPAKRKRPPWYGWALKVSSRDPRLVTPELREGHYYAAELAKNAAERQGLVQEAVAGWLPERLTARRLAEDERVHSAIVYRRIRDTREHLFGPIGDRAIQRRLQLDGGKPPPPRICATDGCGRELPAGSRRNRRYCMECAAPSATVARHRARQRGSEDTTVM